MSKAYLVHKPIAADKVLRSHAELVTPERLTGVYLCQPKYDGVSLIVKVNALSVDAVEIFTRTGEPITSCEHIADCIIKFPGILPGVYFGEAWARGLKQSKINGLVMRHAASPDVQFVVFDYLTLDEWDAGASDLGYTARVNRMPEPFFRIDVRSDTPVWPAVCEGTLDDYGLTPQQAANQYVALGGYDGIILRDPVGKWERYDGRRGEIIKVKPGIDLTLRVIGYEEGKGKHAGRIGALIVSLNGKRQGAGTGLKDSERSIAEFEERWLNKLVELSAMGYTEDGMLREPVLKGVRTDVLEPDA